VHISQADVAERMQDLGFSYWRRQTTARVELGGRRVTAEELAGLMVVFEVDLTVLAYPPGDNQPVSLPGGQEIVFPAARYGVSVHPEGRVWDGNRSLLTRKLVSLQQPVVAAIVTSPLGVLVGRRNDGKPPWTFIAGEQEPGERPEDTAIREVKEETGLRIRAGELIGERVHPNTGRTMIYMAAAPTHGTEAFVGDSEELAEVRWVDLAEADQLLPGMFGPVREHLAAELGEA
jgi:8-oxo-dGTP pyrophosphatase MutT (NUDIX family)